MQVEINHEFLEDLCRQILELDTLRWKLKKTMLSARSPHTYAEIQKRENLLRNDAIALQNKLTEVLSTSKLPE